MTVLNQANAVYVGGNAVAAVYSGAKKVWPTPPLAVPNLQMWLDATTLSPGYVSSWVDRSPNGMVASQPTPANQPTAGTNPDGKPSVLFQNTGTYLDIQGLGSLLGGISAYTMIARVWSLGLGNYPIVLTSPVASGWQWIMEADVNGGMYWGVTTSQYRLYNAGPGPGQWWIVSYVMAATPHAYINGGTELTTARYGPNGDMTITVPGLGSVVRMGAYWDGNYGWNGYISDVLFYNRTLADTERQSIENYLATR